MGQSFARAELKTMIAAIIGRFELSLDDPAKEFDVEPGAILRPRDVMIRMKILNDLEIENR